jgi:hypothetical protein
MRDLKECGCINKVRSVFQLVMFMACLDAEVVVEASILLMLNEKA